MRESEERERKKFTFLMHAKNERDSKKTTTKNIKSIEKLQLKKDVNATKKNRYNVKFMFSSKFIVKTKTTITKTNTIKLNT